MRGLLATFVATCAVLLAVSGATYWRRGLVRHPQDLQLTAIEHLDGAYDRLVLSDSVTENATRDIAFPRTTLPLLTHGWMRMAGQVLLLERALRHVTPRHVDFFMVPDLLLVDVDEEGGGRIRHTYTDTLFTHPSEIAELRAGGDAKAGTQFPWFELFYKALQPGDRNLPERDDLWKEAPRPDGAAESEAVRARIASRKRDVEAAHVTAQAKFFLRRFDDLCRQHAMTCRIIIEPLPASLPRFDRSQIAPLLPHVEIVDVNDLTTFPDGAFHDGWHLRQPDWTAYYRTLLASHGLMQFARRLPEPKLASWDGRPLSFAAGAGPLPAHLSGVYAPEPWGRWTMGTSTEIVLRLTPAAGQARHLVLDATGLVRKGPQTVRLRLDDAPLCARDLTQSGDVTIDCPLPASLDPVFRLVVETSYATAPAEFGEADTRSLGIGLRRLTLR